MSDFTKYFMHVTHMSVVQSSYMAAWRYVMYFRFMDAVIFAHNVPAYAYHEKDVRLNLLPSVGSGAL